MKPMQTKLFKGAALVVMFLAVGCTDILEEQPRGTYTPDYFKTEKGVYGGLTGMYAHLRYIFGNAYFYNATLTGTDEATWVPAVQEVGSNSLIFPVEARLPH